MAKGQEGIKQQMKEISNLWPKFLKKIVEWCARNIISFWDSDNISFQCFHKCIDEKKNFCPIGLLRIECWPEAETPEQWNIIEIKILYWMSSVPVVIVWLQTLNHRWNRNQISGNIWGVFVTLTFTFHEDTGKHYSVFLVICHTGLC